MTQTSSLRSSFLRTPFVGREREVEDLARLLEEVADGRGALVMIGGDAGIGKSRLTEELTSLAQKRSFVALAGHCYEGQGTAPYIAFVEALDAAARAVPDETLRAALQRSGPEVTRLAPPLARLSGKRAPRGLPTENERPHLFAAVREFLCALAEQQPVLLTLEDLHWAEQPSLLLLRSLAQSAESARILIVATHREDEENEAAPCTALAADVRRLRRGHSLRLRPLAPPDVGSMLKGLTGAAAPERVTHAIHQHTEGNPLFVEEVVSHLLEEGRLIGDDGAWLVDVVDADLGVPDSVRRVIGRRLFRISGETRQVLTTAALIGRTFRFDLLAAVANQPNETLLNSLDEAQRARVVMAADTSDGSQLSFAHELVRQTLLTQVSLPRRQQLHVAVVRAIESSRAPEDHIAELARHSVLAGPAMDREATVLYLVAAAERAVATTAYEEAARLYRQALKLAPTYDDARHCDLLLALGAAEKRLSDSDTAREVFHEAAHLAQRLGDADKLCRAALGYARTWPTVGVVDEPAVALLRAALAAARDTPASMRAEVTTRLALQLHYSPDQDEVQQLNAEGVAVARESGDAVALARALQTCHVQRWEPEHTEERLAITAEIIEVARNAQMPVLALWGHRPRIADLLQSGDAAAAEAEFGTYSHLADEVRQPIYIWQAAVRRAMFAIFHGRLIDGERLAGEQLEIGRRAGGQNLLTAYGLQMLVVRWLQGRLSEMEPLARASQQQQPDLALWRAILAFVYAETGKDAEAREQLAALAHFASLPRDDTRMIAVTFATVACASIGTREQAVWLHRELMRAHGHNIVLSEGVACVGAASYYLALLSEASGDRREAERHFTEALIENERSGARPWLALTQHSFARMLLSRRGTGDRKRAMELLDGSIGLARQLGMKGLEESVESLLQSHAGRVPRFPDGLTRREVEVLRFVASGMSNRDISAALVLSLRTTARHVTNIYGKIGVRNRAEATAYAIRNNLSG